MMLNYKSNIKTKFTKSKYSDKNCKKKYGSEDHRKDNGLSEFFEQPLEEDYGGFNGEDDFTINEYYLYNDISIKSVMSLLKFIKNAEKRWNNFLLEFSDFVKNAEPKPLKIFINSNGGEIFAAIPIIDAIINSPIPIYTYIEGMSASAASLISMVGHKRFITKNSFMLIHELRGGVEGTYSNILDEKENCDKIMTVIKRTYLNKTNNKLDNDFLDKILKRDLILTSEECLNYGLVDEIN
jgi:ATP-dependent protease ClpP protease subunit